MSGYTVDPFQRSVVRVAVPEPLGEEDLTLMSAAVEEGADGRDFETCAHHLTGSSGTSVNAYTLWTKTHERAVLFVTDTTEDSMHGFRIGKPGRVVKPAVFYGKGIVLRYRNAVEGVHRTHMVAGTPPALPPPPRLESWRLPPTVEWVHGHHSRFSGPATAPVVFDVEMGRPVVRRADVTLAACAACRDVGQGLLRCGRCGNVKYCSRDCQRAHWRLHKADCH